MRQIEQSESRAIAGGRAIQSPITIEPVKSLPIPTTPGGDAIVVTPDHIGGPDRIDPNIFKQISL